MPTKYVAEVVHGERQIAGTRWPIFSTVERVGPHKWLATFSICNGIPTGAKYYRTKREAVAAIQLIQRPA